MSFSREGLESGIDNCRRNIKALKKAIEVEQQQIASYRCMIDDIDRAAATMKEAEKCEARLNGVSK